jgi:hypothetical protein
MVLWLHAYKYSIPFDFHSDTSLSSESTEKLVVKSQLPKWAGKEYKIETKS